MITISPFQIASTFVGTRELQGAKQDNPLILAFIQTCDNVPPVLSDEVPWCSAFVNFVMKTCRLPRTRSLAAKSWLTIGSAVGSYNNAIVDSDIVILNRGSNPALGHVGFYAGYHSDPGSNGLQILILGGNQSNQVCIESFPVTSIAGIRRII